MHHSIIRNIRAKIIIGLAFGNNKDGSKYENVFVEKSDSINFIGSKESKIGEDNLKEKTEIVKTATGWQKWKYNEETESFYFE